MVTLMASNCRAYNAASPDFISLADKIQACTELGPQGTPLAWVCIGVNGMLEGLPCSQLCPSSRVALLEHSRSTAMAAQS